MNWTPVSSRIDGGFFENEYKGGNAILLVLKMNSKRPGPKRHVLIENSMNQISKDLVFCRTMAEIESLLAPHLRLWCCYDEKKAFEDGQVFCGWLKMKLKIMKSNLLATKTSAQDFLTQISTFRSSIQFFLKMKAVLFRNSRPAKDWQVSAFSKNADNWGWFGPKIKLLSTLKRIDCLCLYLYLLDEMKSLWKQIWWQSIRRRFIDLQLQIKRKWYWKVLIYWAAVK